MIRYDLSFDNLSNNSHTYDKIIQTFINYCYHTQSNHQSPKLYNLHKLYYTPWPDKWHRKTFTIYEICWFRNSILIGYCLTLYSLFVKMSCRTCSGTPLSLMDKQWANQRQNFIFHVWWRTYASVNWVSIASDLSPIRCQYILSTHADLSSTQPPREYLQ